MRKQLFAIIAIVLTASTALFVLVDFMPNTSPSILRSAQAASADVITPTVTAIDPASAPNDLDTPVIITGTDFTAELSGTLVLTSPIAYLGSTALTNVTWVNRTTLAATVPWGMDPGAYPLTVTNPDGGTGSLAGAFTVKNGVGQWNGGDLYGGVGQEVLLKPSDPNTIYVMAYNVGIFRSRDAGEHWSFITSHIGGNATFGIDPLHPAWVYLDASDGIYRSQDEGDTWVKWLDAWPDGRSITMGRVHPSPFNPQVIFVSSSGQPGDPLHGVLGLIKSTDGGTSWKIVNDLKGIPVTDVAFHPTDPLQMVLGTQDGKVFRSSDGGETWSEVTKPPASDIGTITYNPYRPSEVWISNGWMHGSEGAGLYKSTDAAFTTWQDVTPAAYVGNLGTLWCIKFTSADSVYTIKQHSVDGGTTWNWFGPWNGYGEISFAPDNSQVGYIGDITYGVQKTTDGGQTWQVKNRGFAGMIAHQIGASRFDPKRVFATFESWPGIYRSDDGANTWTYFPIENSFNVRWVREDPLDPQRLYVAADSGFYVSTDGGESWSAKGWNVPPSSKTGTVDAFELDPYQAGHMLAGFKVGSDPLTPNFMVSCIPAIITEKPGIPARLCPVMNRPALWILSLTLRHLAWSTFQHLISGSIGARTAAVPGSGSMIKIYIGCSG